MSRRYNLKGTLRDSIQTAFTVLDDAIIGRR